MLRSTCVYLLRPRCHVLLLVFTTRPSRDLAHTETTARYSSLPPRAPPPPRPRPPLASPSSTAKLPRQHPMSHPCPPLEPSPMPTTLPSSTFSSCPTPPPCHPCRALRQPPSVTSSSTARAHRSLCLNPYAIHLADAALPRPSCVTPSATVTAAWSPPLLHPNQRILLEFLQLVLTTSMTTNSPHRDH